jgi:hypothetical protein
VFSKGADVASCTVERLIRIAASFIIRSRRAVCVDQGHRALGASRNRTVRR